MRAALVLLGLVLAAGCGRECRELSEQYDQALGAAASCDPAAATSCERAVPGALDRSVCPSWVDAAREAPLDDLVQRYVAAGCQQAAPPPCPASVGRCEVEGGSGRCVARAPGAR